MFDPRVIEAFTRAKRAFRWHQFDEVDQILPGLDSHIVLSYGVADDTVQAWIKWAQKNRPADKYFWEIADDQ